MCLWSLRKGSTGITQTSQASFLRPREHLDHTVASVVLYILMPWWWASQKWEQNGAEDQLVFGCPRVIERGLRSRDTSCSWREVWGYSSVPSILFTRGKLFHVGNSSLATLLLRRNRRVVFAAKWRSLTLKQKSALTSFNPNDHF